MVERATPMQPMPVLHVSPYRQNIIVPERLANDIHVPSPKLELAVQAFLFQHQFPAESVRTPRSMLIQGDTGTGKTHTVMRAAAAMNVAIMFMEPSVFASKHEDGGIEKITEAMQEAERYSREQRQHVAMLFDDVDHSNLAIDDNTSKTTNPGTIVGHWQSLSTNRHVHVGFTNLPIPLLASANSANKIAASLFRYQRARVYTHVMDEAAKQQVAHTLFAPANHAESTGIAKLFKTYRKENVAFWPALASDYRSKRIEKVIQRYGFDHAQIQRVVEHRAPLDFELLTELAETCRKAKPFDFLAKYRSVR